MDFSQLLTAHYYLDINPGGDFLIGFALLAFFILSMFIGRIANKSAHGNKYLKKSMKKQFWAFPFIGVLVIVSVLSRFAGVPGFSMRIFLYILFVGVIVLALTKALKINRHYKKRVASASRSKKNKR